MRPRPTIWVTLLAVAALGLTSGGASRAQNAPATSLQKARGLVQARDFQTAQPILERLVASEPDVVDPIAAAFDESGRMFVVEMRDYPFTSENNNLTTSELAKSQPSGRSSFSSGPPGVLIAKH